jgi:4-carboxymuconolactone decarboxylase
VRPGLERKTRSILNLGMLSVMGRWHEFEVHVRGALNNGVTEDEIIEIVLQAGVYGGVPVAAEAMRIAERVVKNHKAA